jgi:glycosyltransferase involved in cell wall biosynthesis
MAVENPKVSVILTSYNHEKFLRASIDSVLDQIFQDFELIIWDDASTDSSWDIIKSYDDFRIKAYKNETNEVRGSLNKMIRQVAVGEYIAVLHSDDMWEPTKLEKQVAFLNKNPKIGAVFSDALVIKENGDLFLDETNFYAHIFSQPNRSRYEWLNFFFYKGNALCHPSVLLRKICFDNVGTYRDAFLQIDDFDLWVRLCMQYEIYILPEKLVRFRILENAKNVSADRPDSYIRNQIEFFFVLNHYREIPDIATFLNIFPEGNKWVKSDQDDLLFILGMVAVNSGEVAVRNLFGLRLLFEAVNDPRRSEVIREKYGFSKKDYFELTGRLDVFSVEALKNLTLQVTERDQTIQGLTSQLAEDEQSIQVLISHVAERDQIVQKLTVDLAEQKQRHSKELHRINEEKCHLEENLNTQISQIAELAQALDFAKKEIVNYHNSTSWNVTRPLRWISGKLRGR